MAFDERLQKCAGSLRAVLEPDQILKDLLRQKVLSKDEHDEIDHITRSRGKMEGNRCLIRHLMLGKTARQVTEFMKVISARQPEQVEPILNDRLGDRAYKDPDVENAILPPPERLAIAAPPSVSVLCPGGVRYPPDGEFSDNDLSHGGLPDVRLSHPVQVSDGGLRDHKAADLVVHTPGNASALPAKSSRNQQSEYSEADLDASLNDKRPASDEILIELAKYLPTTEKIQKVGFKLGLKKYQIDEVLSLRDSGLNKAVKMLNRWKGGEGRPRAPREVHSLAKAVNGAGYPGIAAQLCHMGAPLDSLGNQGDPREMSDLFRSEVATRLVGYNRLFQLGRALGFKIHDVESIQSHNMYDTEFSTYVQLLDEWRQGAGSGEKRTVGALAMALDSVELRELARELPTLCDECETDEKGDND